MRRLWLSLLFGVVLTAAPPLALEPLGLQLGAYAASGSSACDPSKQPCFDQVLKNPNDCPGGVQISLPFVGNNKCVSNDPNHGGAIITYLKTILQFLSASIGVVIILMLVIAGIEYITSVGDPTRIKSAKNRIQNALIALFLFLTMFAFLTFVVPGGIL